MAAKTASTSAGCAADQVHHVADGARDERWLGLGRRQDHVVGEALPQHLSLQLQQPVHQPDDAEADLDRSRCHPTRSCRPHGGAKQGACSRLPLNDRRQLGPGQVGLELVGGGQRTDRVQTWSMK